MSWKFILSLLFAVVVAIFALQNAVAVNVKFITWHVSISQALVILISAVFGAVIVMMISMVQQMKLKSNLRTANKKITALEQDNQQLTKKFEEAAAKLSAATAPIVTGGETTASTPENLG